MIWLLKFSSTQDLGRKKMANEMLFINYSNQLCKVCLLSKYAERAFQREQLLEQDFILLDSMLAFQRKHLQEQDLILNC